MYLERYSRARPTGVGETASDLTHSIICVLVDSWNPNPIKRTRLRYLRVYCHWRSPSLFRGLGLRQCTCTVTHFASCSHPSFRAQKHEHLPPHNIFLLSCPRRQPQPQLQVPQAQVSKLSSKLRLNPTKSRLRKTLSYIRLPHNCNRASPLPTSLLSFKIKFENSTNLAVVMRD